LVVSWTILTLTVVTGGAARLHQAYTGIPQLSKPG